MALGKRFRILSYNGKLIIDEFWRWQQKRFRQSGLKIQQRSPKKMVVELENLMDKQKALSKVLTLMDILKKEPEQVMEVRFLEQYKSQINFASISTLMELLKRYNAIFELYVDHRGITWLGFTPAAEALLQEEGQILKDYEQTAINCVRKFLMMSIDKKLQVDKIAHFRQEFLLPPDFRKEWIYKFPEYFRVKEENDQLYLKLNSWDPSLAVTALERQAMENGNLDLRSDLGEPGWLKLPFPLKFPEEFHQRGQHYKATQQFQELPYLSPYADPSCLEPGSKEFEKRAIAVLHEMLSLTIEKRTVTDKLTHFHHEFKLPQKLMRFFLRHNGIFYVTQKGKRYNVFLTAAYEGSELIARTPFTAWKEKVAALMREKKRRVKYSLSNHKDSEVSKDDLDDHNRST